MSLFTEILEKKKLFNPDGDDAIENRKLVGGNPTNLFNLNNVKYAWANRLYRAMMENFWIPEKVDLTMDVLDYSRLLEPERRAYDGILSFLVFLDSVQTNNIPKISEYITAPEVNLVLSIQTYQEAVHSQSYAYTIESIIPAGQRNDIYEFWRDDKILFDRIKFIAAAYQDFHDIQSKVNFTKAIIADYLLEALYFYNGFNFFYLLASRNLMPGTADIIRFINRDELTHMVLFQQMILTLKEENPDFIDQDTVYEMFDIATKQEIEWTHHIIGDEILGLTKQSAIQYTKWLANNRLEAIGFAPLYENTGENPYKHLEKLADTEGEGNVKANFFESTVTSYNQSSAVDGWDEL